MAVRVEVWVRDATGARAVLLDEYARLAWEHRLNEVGTLDLTLDSRTEKVDFLVKERLVEVVRTVDGGTPYVEWTGLIADVIDGLAGRRHEFQVRAVSPLDLLARRVVAYPAGHARTIKDAVRAETILKEFVEHNAGPTATTGGGRLAAGVTPGLTVQADAGGGPRLTGQGSLIPLLPLLGRVAAAASSATLIAAMGLGDTATVFDFDVLFTGTVASVPAFNFQTFTGGRGSDRSLPVVGGTNLNAAGLIPFIFDPALGNLEEPSLRQIGSESANRVYALGRGIRSNQIVGVADNTASQGTLPNLALREAVANAQQAQDQDATDAHAESQLGPLSDIEALDGSILQFGPFLYGRDYFLGDTVTLRFGGVDDDRRVNRVSATVRDGEERLDIGLTEPPTDTPA